MAITSWKGSSTKWTLQAALDVSPMRLAIMDTQKRAELAQFLQGQVSRRLATFQRAGENGYAVWKLGEDFQKINEKLNIDMSPYEPVLKVKGRTRTLSPIFADRKNPQNALAGYINIMQDFLSAKSSTVKGWRKIKEAQDYRLFGWEERVPTKKVGNRQYYKTVKHLDYRMSDEERKTFWKVYRELYKSPWNPINSYDSDIQRKFGSIWVTGKFDKTDFETALAKMQEMIDERPDFLRESAPGTSGDPTVRAQGSALAGENVLNGDYFDEE